MIKYTPGPWDVRPLGKTIRIYSSTANDAEICSIAKSMSIKDANERKAYDANLIAAAPDMYEALNAAASRLDTLDDDGWSEAPAIARWRDQALRAAIRAALAKAGGRS